MTTLTIPGQAPTIMENQLFDNSDKCFYDGDENSSLCWDETSLKSWEPYGRTSSSSRVSKTVFDSVSNSRSSVSIAKSKFISTASTAKTTESSSCSSSTTAGSCPSDDASQRTRKNSSPLSMLLDNNHDSNGENNEIFTPISYESANVRSKRRESIMDFGTSSSPFHEDGKNDGAWADQQDDDLQKSGAVLKFSEQQSLSLNPCPAKASFDCFGINDDRLDSSSPDIVPASSTEAMAGGSRSCLKGSSPPILEEDVGEFIADSSPRSVVSTFQRETVQLKNVPSPGPKRLAVTRRVDWTGLIADDNTDEPGWSLEPSESIENDPTVAFAPFPSKEQDDAKLLGDNQKEKYDTSCANDKGKRHPFVNIDNSIREPPTSLPAWKLLQREHNRRPILGDNNRGSGTSLSMMSSCQPRRTRIILSAPNPTANSSRSQRSQKKNLQNTSRGLSFSSRSERSISFAIEELQQTSNKSKKSAKSKWPEWGSKSDPALLPPAFSALSDCFRPKPQTPVNKKKVQLVPKSQNVPTRSAEEDNVDSNGFPSCPKNLQPKKPEAPSTPKSGGGCGNKPAWMQRIKWQRSRKGSESPATSNAFSSNDNKNGFLLSPREDERSSSTPSARNLPPSLADFSSSFFSIQNKKKKEAAAVPPKTLSWTREKTNNFADYTISVVVDSPGEEDHEDRETSTSKSTFRFQDTFQKQTYHVHKCVVGVGPRGSGLILEKLQQRRSSGSITMIVKLSPKAAEAFPLMLDFMYGCFNNTNGHDNNVVSSTRLQGVTTENAGPLRYLANYFVIPSMFDEVNMFIQNDINSENFHTYDAAAKELNDDDLAKVTASFHNHAPLPIDDIPFQ